MSACNTKHTPAINTFMKLSIHYTCQSSYFRTAVCRKLTVLRIDSQHIRALPPLPAQLQHLQVSGCRNLRSLPPLPGTLETLSCNGCSALQALPESLASTAVTELDCTGCSCLTELPDLPESLQDLDVEECNLFTTVSTAVCAQHWWQSKCSYSSEWESGLCGGFLVRQDSFHHPLSTARCVHGQRATPREVCACCAIYVCACCAFVPFANV
jgi:hypothetical protein